MKEQDIKKERQSSGITEPAFCPDDCQYLKPTEEEQVRYLPVNVKHYCYLHKKTVNHEGHHPRLIRVNECKYLLKGE
jgi:hypothetical protein